jgi:hypothetical protein
MWVLAHWPFYASVQLNYPSQKVTQILISRQWLAQLSLLISRIITNTLGFLAFFLIE